MKPQPTLIDGRFEWRSENKSQSMSWPVDTYLSLRVCLIGPFPPGSRWWVAETWAKHSFGARDHDGKPMVFYRARNDTIMDGNGWRSAIAMPRWASRTLTESTACRVELKDGVWHWVANMRGEKA